VKGAKRLAFIITSFAARYLGIIGFMLAQPNVDLNFWKKHLGHVPDEVWDVADQLETLVLADNDLVELPDRIATLTRLRMLDLGHNALTMLPLELGALVELSHFLYLHDNQLTTLPDSLRSLTKLRYLNLSENRFETLPARCARWWV
jgi:Leucine-rich repeat (LRR) protein